MALSEQAVRRGTFAQAILPAIVPEGARA